LQHQPLAEALRAAQRALPGASSFLHCCNLVNELSCPPGATGAAAPLSLADRIQAEYLLLRLLAGGASASPDAPDGIPPFAPALLSLFEQRGAAADAAELHSRVERLWLATLLCSSEDVIEAVVSGARVRIGASRRPPSPVKSWRECAVHLPPFAVVTPQCPGGGDNPGAARKRG